MSDDERPKMTAFDSALEEHYLQIIKVAIPYIHAPVQKLISIFVQAQELLNTAAYYQKKDSCLEVCSTEMEGFSLTNMLEDIRAYCYDNEKEAIDLFLNFYQVMQMYNMYQDTFGEAETQDTSTPFSFEMLKGMLTPEQQSIFDTYSMLFQNL